MDHAGQLSPPLPARRSPRPSPAIFLIDPRIGALGGSRAEATAFPITGAILLTSIFSRSPLRPPGSSATPDAIPSPGPFQLSINAALNRAWRIGESRRQFQLRLSATNALNHAVITGFGNTVNSSTYGLATSASATRVVSLLLRFNSDADSDCTRDRHGLYHRISGTLAQAPPAQTASDLRPEKSTSRRTRIWSSSTLTVRDKSGKPIDNLENQRFRRV